MAGVTRPRTIFKQRRGLAATWSSVNPVLADGEFGIEVWPSGPEMVKAGDGVTAWNDLDYIGGGGGGITLQNVFDALEPSTPLVEIYEEARGG